MPAPKSRRAHTLPNDSRQTTIPILQVVDTIHLDENGEDLPPITAAFKSCGEFIQDQADNGRDVHLEFTYAGLEFSADFHAPPRPEPADIDRMD